MFCFYQNIQRGQFRPDGAIGKNNGLAGPAGRREAIWSDNSFLAATKYGLPALYFQAFRHLVRAKGRVSTA